MSPQRLRRPSPRSAAGRDDDPITERLREAITGGSYQPNEHLVEEEVARRLGTTRGRIRPAITRLEQEGLIVRQRNRGARVRLVSEREAVEILESRAALEIIVARYAAQNATHEDALHLLALLSELEANHASGDFIACSHLNSTLHEVIAEIAKHATATQLLGILNSQIVRFQYRSYLQPGRMDHSVQEHREIILAIADNDPDAAERAMREHLRNAITALKWSLEVRKHKPSDRAS